MARRSSTCFCSARVVIGDSDGGTTLNGFLLVIFSLDGKTAANPQGSAQCMTNMAISGVCTVAPNQSKLTILDHLLAAFAFGTIRSRSHCHFRISRCTIFMKEEAPTRFGGG